MTIPVVRGLGWRTQRVEPLLLRAFSRTLLARLTLRCHDLPRLGLAPRPYGRGFSLGAALRNLLVKAQKLRTPSNLKV